MKKMIKKTSALAISAFMLAQYIPFTSIAATDSSHCDLYIHPYILDQDDYNTAKSQKDTKPPTGKTTDEANVPGSNTVNTAMKFNIVQVNSNGSTYTGSGTAVSLTDVSAVVTNSNVPSAATLPDGYYKITPANKSDTDARFTDAESFIIQIPVPDGGSVNRDVHIYPKFVDNNDQDTNGTTPGNETPKDNDTHNVTLTKTESGSTNPAVPVVGAEYKLYYKNATGNWQAGAATYTTDGDGHIIVTGLPLGDYYFVEQSAPTDYLLDQTPIGFTIDGATAATVNPTNDKKLSVGKVIATDAAGNTYNWTITADLPTNRANLSSYTIVDQFKGITINPANVTITNSTKTKSLINGTDFTASIGTGADADKLTIIITDFAKIKDSSNTNYISDDHLTITVPSTLDNSALTDSSYATGAGAAYNMAQISYEYGYVPGAGDPDIPDAPNTPVTITEPTTLPDPTKPNDPNTPAPGDPSNPNTPIEVIKPCTFTISNVNGEDELENAKYVIKSGDDNGVAYTSDELSDSTTSPYVVTVSNLAPGHYKIYQTGVDSDHLLNQNPIDIYVGKDGNIYSDAECNSQIINDKGTTDASDDVKNQVKFYNEKISDTFNLPFTGTTATIIFSITGILLMAGTGFLLFILLKKKDDDEEEQENN